MDRGQLSANYSEQRLGSGFGASAVNITHRSLALSPSSCGGPQGRTLHSDEPKHALGLVQYLRTIGYTAWIEDTNGNEIEETALKKAIKSPASAEGSGSY
jgi:hypothetical protein